MNNETISQLVNVGVPAFIIALALISLVGTPILLLRAGKSAISIVLIEVVILLSFYTPIPIVIFIGAVSKYRAVKAMTHPTE